MLIKNDKQKKALTSAFPPSITELGNHHIYPQNKKKAKQTENQ